MSSGKRCGNPSPADRAREWDRQHGVTPELRKKVGGRVVGVLVVLFVLGAVLVGLLAGVVGMRALPGNEGGRGHVAISQCEPHELLRHRCQGSVSAWSGSEHRNGDRVEVLSRSALQGRVEVVARVRGGTETDAQGRTVHVTEPVLVPAGDWIMPNGWRIATFVAFGTTWVVLMWWLARVAFVRLLRREQRREMVEGQ